MHFLMKWRSYKEKIDIKKEKEKKKEKIDIIIYKFKTFFWQKKDSITSSVDK